MKKPGFFFISFLLLSLCGCTQQVTSGRIIFYNTENFFDTIKDPKTDDAEFTPEGKAHWTSERYQHKLDNISKVLRVMTEAEPPIFIGLSEIENRKVAGDIASHSNLQKYDLGVIEHDSPDPRGIDVALLYNKKLFTVTDTEFLVIKRPDVTYGTREILYVKGEFNGVDIHVFVNHWPSRREGKQKSEAARIAAAIVIKNKIAKIRTEESAPHIVIIGDLNDNPTDSSIQQGLIAVEPGLPLHGDSLYDLMAKPYKDGLFTLKFRGENDVFDQMIVSGNLINASGPLHIKDAKGRIYNVRWLMFSHPKYGLIPSRTYTGTQYYGGFSDHLPVYMDLEFVKN